MNVLEQLFDVGTVMDINKWIYDRLPSAEDVHENGWNCFACAIQGDPFPGIAVYDYQHKCWYRQKNTADGQKSMERINVIAWHSLSSFDHNYLESLSKISSSKPKQKKKDFKEKQLKDTLKHSKQKEKYYIVGREIEFDEDGECHGFYSEKIFATSYDKAALQKILMNFTDEEIKNHHINLVNAK